MIIKILGILDIIVAISFWLFGVFNLQIMSGFILVLGLFLLAKGIVFITGMSITSVLDIISAIIIISAVSIHMPFIVVVIVSLFLIQKGVFSLLS